MFQAIHQRRMLAALVYAGFSLGASGLAQAQEIRPLGLSTVPPDMIQEGAPQSTSMVSGGTAPESRRNDNPLVDLGEKPASAVTAASDVAPALQGTTPARLAARSARVGNVRTVRPAGSAIDTERAVFSREPIRVTLPLRRERLVTLPAPAALHVPVDIEAVARMEVIDRTIYIRALVPFTTLRVVAELIDSGQQIPLDLEASALTARATGELEVFVVDTSGAIASTPGSASTGAPANAEPAAPAMQDADMVQLTRHAARMLYAPRRLAWATPNVHQVAVATTPVVGLLRGVDVEIAPVGQWKSGSLYVTALRVTNRSHLPVELPLEGMRGRWLASTAQHGRLGPKGTEIDTTAIYLVCDRAFEACL